MSCCLLLNENGDTPSSIIPLRYMIRVVVEALDVRTVEVQYSSFTSLSVLQFGFSIWLYTSRALLPTAPWPTLWLYHSVGIPVII